MNPERSNWKNVLDKIRRISRKKITADVVKKKALSQNSAMAELMRMKKVTMALVEWATKEYTTK